MSIQVGQPRACKCQTRQIANASPLTLISETQMSLNLDISNMQLRAWQPKQKQESLLCPSPEWTPLNLVLCRRPNVRPHVAPRGLRKNHLSQVIRNVPNCGLPVMCQKRQPKVYFRLLYGGSHGKYAEGTRELAGFIPGGFPLFKACRVYSARTAARNAHRSARCVCRGTFTPAVLGTSAREPMSKKET